MENNPLKQSEAFGQSIWLDSIRRDLIASGELKRLIDEDGLRGMTSNPAIFEKAIVDSHDYDEEIRALALSASDAKTIYEQICPRDVQSAAEVFRPHYDRTDGAGLETQAAEGKRIHRIVSVARIAYQIQPAVRQADGRDRKVKTT